MFSPILEDVLFEFFSILAIFSRVIFAELFKKVNHDLNYIVTPISNFLYIFENSKEKYTPERVYVFFTNFRRCFFEILFNFGYI